MLKPFWLLSIKQQSLSHDAYALKATQWERPYLDMYQLAKQNICNWFISDGYVKSTKLSLAGTLNQILKWRNIW